MVGIFEILQPERTETLLASLLGVWRESVRASHRFLTEKDILHLEPFVPEAILNTERLFVVCDNGVEAGFMGVAGREIEMLFISPRIVGHGVGRRLVELAVKSCGQTVSM